MRDRPESVLVLLTLAVALSVVVLNGLLSLGEYERLGLAYIAQASFALMWGYSVFWAFSIRHLLSVRFYRDQALGVGLVAIGWAAFNYSFLLSNNVIPNLAFAVASLLSFYWIDASILAGRKSDPLYRNTLHWRELRRMLWPVVVAAVGIELVGLLFAPPDFAIIISSGIVAKPPVVPLALLLVMFLTVFVPGPVYLLASAFRSRDPTFRKNLQWFGLFAASFSILLSVAVASGQSTIIALAYIAGTYCLYRSAKSLAPINRLTLTGSVKAGRAG